MPGAMSDSQFGSHSPATLCRCKAELCGTVARVGIEGGVHRARISRVARLPTMYLENTQRRVRPPNETCSRASTCANTMSALPGLPPAPPMSVLERTVPSAKRTKPEADRSSPLLKPCERHLGCHRPAIPVIPGFRTERDSTPVRRPCSSSQSDLRISRLCRKWAASTIASRQMPSASLANSFGHRLDTARFPDNDLCPQQHSACWPRLFSLNSGVQEPISRHPRCMGW